MTELERGDHVEVVGELVAGDQVVVTLGRFRGARAVVVDVAVVPTPGGGRVSLVRIRRPRAGETWLFTTDVRPAGTPAPPKVAAPTGFGGSGFDE